VICIVADNTNTNPCIARELDVNFIGCFSHKLNLAVENYLLVNEHNELVEKVHQVFVKLRSSANFVAKLEKYTKIKVQVFVLTRWSSKYKMTMKYIELHDILLEQCEELEVEELLLEKKELKALKKLHAELDNFEDCTSKFQEDDCHLGKVYDICQKLCKLSEKLINYHN
jgi:hypothetical protein